MFWSPGLAPNDWLVQGLSMFQEVRSTYMRCGVYYHGGCENVKVPWKIVFPRNGDVFYLD